MKTMTCIQMGGPCDKKFHAVTFSEMAELSKKHGMEMYKEGDEKHIEVMNKMREQMNEPDAMKKYMEHKKELFDSISE